MASSVWVNFACSEQTKYQLASATQNPVHSYLFLGSSQMVEAAIRFAATLIVSDPHSTEELERAVKLGLSDSHPDIVVIRPEGSSLRVADAETAIAAAATTPLEAQRKVVVIPSVDVIEANAIGKLLKVVEEPPPSVHFVLLAESVIPEIITIASRCFEVRFPPLTDNELVKYLQIHTDGVVEKDLAGVVAAAAGNFERATDLIADPDLVKRFDWWKALPQKLDGKGATIAELVGSYSTVVDQALEVVGERQSQELEELDEHIEQGTRPKGERSTMVASHKREQRKVRSQELRFGFSVLAGYYSKQLAEAVTNPATDASANADSLDQKLIAIQQASENLIRNPNETLLLQNLLIQLDN